MDYRIEHDSMGEIAVPANKYWGAATERSRENFKIGAERMPMSVIYSLGLLKAACAIVNHEMKPEKMTEEKANLIASVVLGELTLGKLDDNFPLSVWQTGSGTQTNMNVNEVIANRANELAGCRLLHPNDDVNMSQSSNDAFPTAMHMSAVIDIDSYLIPALRELIATFKALEAKNKRNIKSGRTHLQDATPISFSQEISGWRASLEKDLDMIKDAERHLSELAIGGTAVGTGLNAPKGFDAGVCKCLSTLTGKKFTPAKNKFHALSSKSELVLAHGALKALAADLVKIANDVRLLASGPRCGIGEITIPENEPGSSIMPGKVNPTQCEALTMVCAQVMGNDTTVGFAASQGNFQLNVYMPVTIHCFLQSVRLLADAISSFRERCAVGIKARPEVMKKNLHGSLMLVTALTPYIGYEKGAEVAKLAYGENLSLKDACLRLGYLGESEFDEYFHPERMI
ncbi:MAG: class II fumarate hydratase [Clostridia bacterium]|nr:class II fumarate hydratase [Clostridia bacterium]